jgi:hypothetical protein
LSDRLLPAKAVSPAYISPDNEPVFNSSFIHYPKVKYNIVMTKKWIMLGMIVGSFAGSYVPVLWGDSAFSLTSFFFGGLGGLIGIWAGYKIAD